ncbi:PAS domain S-box protein [Pelomonas saccharophila]|nr:PAS domain S-box protein [Roseateles saccharophilus]
MDPVAQVGGVHTGRVGREAQHLPQPWREVERVGADLRSRLSLLAPTPATRRLLRVIWPFLAAMALLLLLTAASFALLSAGRAYVEGESLWSKGQKNAIQALARYSDSCEARHFAHYQAEIAVPLGDRLARLELLRSRPRLERATAGFLQGGNDPAEIPGMIFLFRHFRSLPVFSEALDIWTRADGLLLRIDAAAEALDEAVRRDCANPAARRAVLDEIYRLNDTLTPLQRQFSEALARANRLINTVLLALMAALSLVLAALGIVLSRRVVQQGAAAERSLALSEDRLRLAATGSNQGLWDLEVGTDTLYLSPGLRQMLGFPADAARVDAADLRDRVHPQDRAGSLAAPCAGAAADGKFDEEFRLRTADGSYRWFRAAGQAIGDARDRCSRVVASIQDVTDRHLLQRSLLAELRQRRSALATLRAMLPTLGPLPAADAIVQDQDDIAAVTRAVALLSARQVETHARLEAILELSRDAFVSFDADGKVRHVSPAFAAITGVAPDEVMGRTATHFSARMNRQCSPGQRFPSLEQLRDAGQDGLLDFELALPQPRTLTAELNEGSHEAIRSVLCLRDVTRQRALDRLKSEFISLAAHELRTPMASIFGFVELLLSQPATLERRTEALMVIHRQARLMMGIIDDLLDLDRLQAGGAAELHIDSVDLNALLHKACADFAPPAGREPPLIEALPPAAVIDADADKVRRVLLNLLSNAYKYSPAGGPVRLGIVEADGPAGLGLYVQDQGIGMTPEQLARVGERFYRADGSGKLPGTGLGVSIAREILHLHGGHFDIESTEGVGTRATAWFRRSAAVAQRRRA